MECLLHWVDPPCDNGNHPVGALLVDANCNVVVEGENTVVTQRDCTGHAETNVMQVASERFDPTPDR